MSVLIDESGVTFGPFDGQEIFHIEQWTKEHRLADNGVAIVEFIVRDLANIKPSVALVEAKSSIPRELDDFFAEIRLKMVCSLTLWFNILAKRATGCKAIEARRLNNIKHLQYRILLVLVIPKIPDNMLAHFSDKLRTTLKLERHIWFINYSNIMVLNEKRAREHGLII